MTIWRKSSYSGGTSTQSDCVEAAQLEGVAGLRDSKAPEAGHLAVSPAVFADLVARVKRDDLSR